MEAKEKSGLPENPCDVCGEEGAVFHLTQVENDEMKTQHLCSRCAEEKGVNVNVGPPSTPLHDFLANMGDEPRVTGSQAEGCPFCGMQFKDFRELGRLGCPQCYTAFEGYLRGLLRRVHGSTAHVGKVYLPPDPTSSDMEKRLEMLRRKLTRAVGVEDFERAAELRDEIRGLEQVV